MERTTVRLVIQFDGTDFCGWQVQSDVRTAQGVLSEAVRRLTGHEATLHSSSRTDSGVHALAMPVSFVTEADLPMRAYALGLNSLLPPDLKVISAEKADPSFSARFSPGTKTYRYRVLNRQTSLPMERRISWHVPTPLDAEAMREACAHLVGEHDFTTFRSVHCDALSPVRTVDRIDLSHERKDVVVVEVAASGFLRNMVRIIVGTLVQVGLGRHGPSWVKEVLDARDRTAGGPTAPPQGLFLVGVEYRDPATLS